jgi:hypothetical protein
MLFSTLLKVKNPQITLIICVFLALKRIVIVHNEQPDPDKPAHGAAAVSPHEAGAALAALIGGLVDIGAHAALLVLIGLVHLLRPLEPLGLATTKTVRFHITHQLPADRSQIRTAATTGLAAATASKTNPLAHSA